MVHNHGFVDLPLKEKEAKVQWAAEGVALVATDTNALLQRRCRNFVSSLRHIIGIIANLLCTNGRLQVTPAVLALFVLCHPGLAVSSFRLTVPLLHSCFSRVFFSFLILIFSFSSFSFPFLKNFVVFPVVFLHSAGRNLKAPGPSPICFSLSLSLFCSSLCPPSCIYSSF